MLGTGAINFTFQPKESADGAACQERGRPISTTCDETNHGPHKSDACGRDDVGEVGGDGTLVSTAAQLNANGPAKPGAWPVSSVILSAFQK